MATPHLLEAILPSPTLAAADRLQIYAEAYFARLHQVLRESFPRVAEHAGDDCFRQLTKEYLGANPSQHPSIGYVGARFAQFIVERGVQPAYLADLARLEWAQALAFEGADASTLTVDALRVVPPEDWPQLQFATVPTLCIVALDHPVQRLWRDRVAKVHERESVRVRVWRKPEFQVLHSVLDPMEDQALRALIAGGTFAEVCAAFAELPDDEAASQSIAQLVRWIEDGLLVSDFALAPA